MQIFFKINKKDIYSILIIFLLFLIFNNSLILNISTALTDWYDYPLIVYIIQENINQLSILNFSDFSNVSMFYPSSGGKYFADLLLPQSFLGLFIFPLVNNFITTHNLVFFIVWLLNIISLQYFWSILFKEKRVVFLLNLLFTFSPYVFSMYPHYQMLSYWFFFFSLGKLITAIKPLDFLLSGLFSGLQFLAGVYLGIFSITVSVIFFVWQIIKDKKIYLSLNRGVIFLLGFTLAAGYFSYKYFYIQNLYDISRSAEDYVNQAMQITDYFFNPLPSLWTEKFYKYINIYNHRLGNETFGTGFVLLTSSIIGFCLILKAKLNKKQKFINGFIILMFAWGLIASLGPRLTINGKYLAIPLPYILPLKLTPVFSALRVISRWFFVVQICLLYFVGFSINYIFKNFSAKKAYAIILLTLLLYAIEIVPINQRTTIDTYKSYSYDQIIANCNPNQVVLEYPFAPEQPKTHVLITLNYWVKMILNLMHYDCKLVNGYSGYQPKHIDDFYHFFRLAVENSDKKTIDYLIANKNITYIKFNKAMMLNESIERVLKLFTTADYKILINDNEYLVVMTR